MHSNILENTMLARFLQSPRTIGCVCASSPFLGRALTEMIGPDPDTRVLELGSGTGSITAQILLRLASPDLLTCIEIDRQMCAQFRKSFPGIKLLEMDCRKIEATFGGQTFSNIVSSLPYRSLPRATTDSIFEQKISLSNRRTVISMFSYDFVFNEYQRRYPIRLIGCQNVWLNLPPAKVYHFTL
ncbi:MAG: methyltransferase domain-containing protein [Gammaproteobacteria bacterium]|jgi:phospholipid N-methyltransferase